MRIRNRLSSPAAAVLLTVLFPGLGHWAIGHGRRGLKVAVPAIALSVLAVVLFIFNRHAIFDSLFSSSLVLVDGALLLYRVWAIVDAYMMATAPAAGEEIDSRVQSKKPVAPPSRVRFGRNVTTAILGAVILANVGAQVALGALVVQYRDVLDSAFSQDAPGWFGSGNLIAGETLPPLPSASGALDEPTASDSATNSGASPSAVGSATAGPSASMPVVTPAPTTDAGIPVFTPEQFGANTTPEEWRADGYLNVLLVGIDQGVGRWSLRPDTNILLQVQISTGKAVMYGIPRNLENIPLPPEAASANPCHCFPYPNLLNALWLDAVRRPTAYPYAGTDFVRGFKAMEGAVGEYLGLHVDGAVVINLMGFVKLIDALLPDGLSINVPTKIVDKQYSRPQDGVDITITINAGQQRMNGFTALAYARSRHQDSDYGRMSRQQDVLLALRKQVDPCAVLPRVPTVLSALGDALWTDMPKGDASALAAIAQRVGTGNIKSVELTPAVTGNPVGFLTVPRLATVRNLVAHGLDDVPASTTGGGGGSGGGGLSC